MAENVKKSGFRELLSNTKKFFKDVGAELKKVIWPTPKQITNNTVVVIAAVICVGIVLWLFDFGFKALVAWLLTFRK